MILKFGHNQGAVHIWPSKLGLPTGNGRILGGSTLSVDAIRNKLFISEWFCDVCAHSSVYTNNIFHPEGVQLIPPIKGNAAGTSSVQAIVKQLCASLQPHAHEHVRKFITSCELDQSEEVAVMVAKSLSPPPPAELAQPSHKGNQLFVVVLHNWR